MAKRGDELMKKAKSYTDAMFFKDYEKAYENYISAGAQFKLDKEYSRAGEAYMLAGTCAVKLKNDFEATQAYVDSANAYKKVDVEQAGLMLKLAIDRNIEANRLGNAARLEKDFAEALESEGKTKEAIEHYQKAHNYFFAEDQPQSAIGCKVKMAKLQGELDHFQESLVLYEEIGNFYAESTLKHQAKEFFLRAVLCRLAMVGNDNRSEQVGEAHEAFESYQSIDPNLKHTREAEFVNNLLEAMEDNDVDKFDDAVQLLNDLRQLDDWKTHLLLVMKRTFEDLT